MPQSRKGPSGNVWSFPAVLACVVVVGCGHAVYRDKPWLTKDADTDIVAGDHIAIILSRYRRDDLEVKELEIVN